MAGIKYWLLNGSFSFVNRLTIFVFGFATYFVLVRYLDKADFGVYTIYLIIVTFVEMSRNGFIQNGYIKYTVNKVYDNDEVLTASLYLNLIITSFLSVLLFALSDFIGIIYEASALTFMIRVYCASSIVMVPLSQITYYFNAKVNFKIISLISLARYGSYFLFSVVVYFFFQGVSLVQISILHALSVVIGLLACIVFVSLIKVSKLKFNKTLFWDLFNFGKYTFGVGITSLITRSVDQLMIGYFLKMEAVATYNVAGRFMNFIEVPIASISQVVYPRIVNTLNADNPQKEQARMYEKSTGIILATIAPFALLIYFLPSFFINIVAGEKYLDASLILQIFMIFNLIKPYATQAGSILEIMGKPQVGFYSLLASTIVNIVLNYILIPLDGPYGGMVGAAIATVISGTFFLSLALGYIYRSSKFSFINSLREFLNAYRLGINLILKQVSKPQQHG